MNNAANGKMGVYVFCLLQCLTQRVRQQRQQLVLGVVLGVVLGFGLGLGLNWDWDCGLCVGVFQRPFYSCSAISKRLGQGSVYKILETIWLYTGSGYHEFVAKCVMH